MPELIPDYREGGEYLIKDLDDPYFQQLGAGADDPSADNCAEFAARCFRTERDLAQVPPKAATIGPLDVLNAKERIETHWITTGGQFSMAPDDQPADNPRAGNSLHAGIDSAAARYHCAYQ